MTMGRHLVLLGPVRMTLIDRAAAQRHLEKQQYFETL
jgi:hypothetical protein